MCECCYKNSEFFDLYVDEYTLKWRLNGPVFQDVFWELDCPKENGCFDYQNHKQDQDDSKLVLLPACPSLILSYIKAPNDKLDWR